MKHERGLLRATGGHHHNRVTNIELFFDVVFAFAITQLSHTLIEHFTLQGAAETLVLLLAIWWVWIDTAWMTNWLDPDQPPVRFMMLGLMLAALVLSAAIPQAFESRGLAFGLVYMIMQAGRPAFVIWAFHHHPVQRQNFRRIFIWRLLASLAWLGGGLVEGQARLAIWLLALALETLAPSLGFWVPGLGRSATRDWDVEGAHFAERCGLFIIIALGESILATGATFGGSDWDLLTLSAFAIACVGSFAMWWLYFDSLADFASETIAASSDPGRLARSAYTYIHAFIVAGIIVSAVADEFVLAHPAALGDLNSTLSVLGGPALYLLGNLLFKWAIVGKLRISHAIGMAALLALVALAVFVPALALAGAAALVLVAIALWEAQSKRRGLPRLAHTRAG